MPRDWDTYELPEEHISIFNMWLRKLAQKKPNEWPHDKTLPPEIRDAYIKRRWLADKAGYTLTLGDLSNIFIAAGLMECLPGEEPVTAFELYERGELKDGDAVKVLWRLKIRDGAVIGIDKTSTKVIVQVDGDERKFNPKNVYVPGVHKEAA